MAVVAFHVVFVEEFVEGGGELVCVAGGVLCGVCWSKAVFDVVPRVHDFCEDAPRPIVGGEESPFLSLNNLLLW